MQGVDFDLQFFRSVYRRLRGRPFRLLREDFCGTAALACTWVARRPERRAWGVDLHRPTLDWSAAHRLPLLGRARDRIALVHADVRDVKTPRVDVVCALNCSYWVFKRREDLTGYFRRARAALRRDGLLVLDLFGGEAAHRVLVERRRVRGHLDHYGRRVPPFTYVWEQKSFNPVDHHLVCHIHFDKLADGRSMRRAFRYDWRLWTVPELREALVDAGFGPTHVYVQGWDDDSGQPLDVYRRRVRFDNQDGWLAYIVAER